MILYFGVALLVRPMPCSIQSLSTSNFNKILRQLPMIMASTRSGEHGFSHFMTYANAYHANANGKYRVVCSWC